MKGDESKRRDLLIKEAFAAQKRQLPNEKIHVIYRITPKGKILEVEFIVPVQSKLSIEDIALIEQTLKNKYTVKMDAEKFKGMKFTVHTAPLDFGKVNGL